MAVKIKQSEDIWVNAECSVCKRTFRVREGNLMRFTAEEDGVLTCPFCGKKS